MKLGLGILAMIVLAGCSDGPQTSPRDAELVGETENGMPIYRFKLSRSNALGISSVSNRAIEERAIKICPTGYEELGRSGEATRRISGVIYTDVVVTILCQ